MSASLLTSNEAHVVLFGATSIGKGFTVKLLNAQGFPALGMGDLAREKFQTDPQFKSRCGPVMARGELLPDHEAIPLFEEGVRKLFVRGDGKEKILDGFGRSTGQVTYMVRHKILNPQSLFVMMHGTRSTCKARADHRAEQTGKPRPDVGMFNERFDLHQRSAEGIRRTVERSGNGARIIHIDADREIEAHVFPDILAAIRGHRQSWQGTPVTPLALSGQHHTHLPQPACMVPSGH